MAGAFRAARSTKCDSHARWLHCIVRLRIPIYSNGFLNHWIGFALDIHGLDSSYSCSCSKPEIRLRVFGILYLRADDKYSGIFISRV